jgi:hypothetical protein
MRIKFTEDPLAWIGVRTWPFVMTHRLARRRGRNVIIVACIAFFLWATRS